MALGKFYRSSEDEIDRQARGWKLMAALVVYIAYISLTNLYIGHGGSKMIVDSMVITTLGLMLIIYVSKKFFNNSRFLLFVGANTLFYFAFHGKVYSLILTLGHKAWPAYVAGQSFWTDLTIGFLVAFLDALILIVPAMLVNKYTPQILGKNFKLW